MTTSIKDKFAAFNTADYTNGQSSTEYAFAQFFNCDPKTGYGGTLAIQFSNVPDDETDQASKAGFDVQRALKSGWRVVEDVTLGENDGLRFIVTENPAFHVIRSKVIEVRNDNSPTRFDTQLLVVFVDSENVPLSTEPMTIRLRGKSGAGGSFYDLHNNLKAKEPCFLKQIWNLCEATKRANRKMQALFVMRCELEVSKLGQGKDKSWSTRFASVMPISEETLDDVFVGFDEDKKQFIETLFDETEAFSARRDKNGDGNNTAPQSAAATATEDRDF